MLREQRQAFWERVRAGAWAWEAAEAVGVSGGHGQRLFALTAEDVPDGLLRRLQRQRQ